MGKAEKVARARRKRRVYYPPRLKLFLLALIFIAVAAASALALISGGPVRSAEITYALAGSFAIFGCGGALILFLLKKRRPAVAMNEAGLTIRVAPGRRQHIRWDEITDLRIFQAPQTQMLGVTHRLVHAHWTDKAAFWRWGSRIPDFAETAIPSTRLAAPLEKVEAQIRRRIEL